MDTGAGPVCDLYWPLPVVEQVLPYVGQDAVGQGPRVLGLLADPCLPDPQTFTRDAGVALGRELRVTR